MRLCAVITCDEAASVWWHGPHCGYHADQMYGRVPTEMAKIAIATADREVNAPARVAGVAAASVRPTREPTSEVVPVLGRQASTSGSLGVSEPVAPLLSVDELEALLARDYVGGPGLVEAS